MAASEVTSFETNFFRIVGTSSETETSVSGKVGCLLAVSEDIEPNSQRYPKSPGKIIEKPDHCLFF